jgi:hypothetical protein
MAYLCMMARAGLVRMRSAGLDKMVGEGWSWPGWDGMAREERDGWAGLGWAVLY